MLESSEDNSKSGLREGGCREVHMKRKEHCGCSIQERI